MNDRADAASRRRVAHLRLEIVLDANPICGTVATAGGATHSFTGWLALVRTIEDAVADATRPTSAT